MIKENEFSECHQLIISETKSKYYKNMFTDTSCRNKDTAGHPKCNTKKYKVYQNQIYFRNYA